MKPTVGLCVPQKQVCSKLNFYQNLATSIKINFYQNEINRVPLCATKASVPQYQLLSKSINFYQNQLRSKSIKFYQHEINCVPMCGTQLTVLPPRPVQVLRPRSVPGRQVRARCRRGCALREPWCLNGPPQHPLLKSCRCVFASSAGTDKFLHL